MNRITVLAYLLLICCPAISGDEDTGFVDNSLDVVVESNSKGRLTPRTPVALFEIQKTGGYVTWFDYLKPKMRGILESKGYRLVHKERAKIWIGYLWGSTAISDGRFEHALWVIAFKPRYVRDGVFRFRRLHVGKGVLWAGVARLTDESKDAGLADDEQVREAVEVLCEAALEHFGSTKNEWRRTYSLEGEP